MDNFLTDDYDKLIEFDLSIPPIFSSNIADASKFIKKYLNDGYKIIICSNFLNRLKEVFEEYGFKPIETPILCYFDILSDKYDENNDILQKVKFTNTPFYGKRG